MVGKIIDKKEVAQGTLQVTFEVKEDFTFKPGQYIFVTLTKLNYPDERGPKRQFSIVNSPEDKGKIIITTRITESGFKKTLNELPQGSEVELGPIAGAFVLPDDISRPLVLIAGGIGITPYMSMLRHIAKEKLPYKITLVFSNRNQALTAFLNEIQNFQFSILNFQLILTMTDDPSWSGEKRKVDAQFIREYFHDVNAQNYMVVGPPKMVDAVNESLLEAGVDISSIKIENFTGY